VLLPDPEGPTTAAAELAVDAVQRQMRGLPVALIGLADCLDYQQRFRHGSTFV
jgi:hypothetical protein